MQLAGVSLRNIRSFESARLDLAAGTTLLVGDVGAGKTSVLYAIEMALFGAAEVDAAFLVRHGRQQAEVAVRLRDAEHRYEVARRFRRVKRRGRESFEPEGITLSEDGRPTSYSATELRRRVIDLVGFPDNPNPQAHSDLWRWAIYVPQERMREILSADPDERLQTVRKALGVERFRVAAENAARLASQLRGDARQRREATDRLAHWDDDLARARAELDEVAHERLRLEAEVAELTAATDAARDHLRSLEQELAAGLADERELEALAREDLADRRATDEAEQHLEGLRRELRATESERSAGLERAGQREELTRRLDTLDRERDRIRADLDRHEEAVRQATVEEAELAARARNLDERTSRRERAATERRSVAEALETARAEGPTREPPAPTPKTIAGIDEALQRARADDRTALDRLVRARSDLDATEELLRAGVCPTCHQPVRASDFGTHRDEAARAVEESARQHAAVTESVHRLEEERKARERFERAHDRWRELEHRRESLARNLALWEAELRANELPADGATTVAGTVDALAQRLLELRTRQRQLKAAWEEAGGARSRLSAEVEQAGRAEERVRGLERSLERTREEVGRVEAEAEVRAARSTARAERLARLRTTTVALPEQRSRAEARRAESAQLERRLATVREQYVRAETRREGLEGRVALAERGQADRAHLLAEASVLDGRARWVDEPLRYHLLAMEKDLLAHAQLSFDRAFARYFSTLVDDPGLLARTDARFTPEVSLNGAITPAEALSGGERTSLALAFRLALASTVRSLGTVRLETLLLDEPTDGFSSEQVVRMGELLDELALPQVVIVSHESQLEGIADKVVRIVKVGGRSEIVGSTPPAIDPADAGFAAPTLRPRAP